MFERDDVSADGAPGEFELIARIAAVLEAKGVAGRGEAAIGDDCAVVRVGGERMLLACDMLVEGRHFLRDHVTSADLGYKALAVNVSDIAAMGGTPLHAVMALSLPPDAGAAYAEGIAEGIAEAALRFGVSVVGGDTTAGDAVVLDVTVTGILPAGRAVTRAGARPGDLFCVTGSLGGSDGGLRVLLAERSVTRTFPPGAEALVLRHRRPEPRLAAGVAAARSGATAMIDISDGLVADAGHIAGRSSVAIDIARAAIPLAPGLPEVAEVLGFDAHGSALRGGEDYELALTVAPERFDELRAAVDGGGAGLTVVGRVHEGRGVTVDGAPVAGAGGWDHFRQESR